MSARGVILDAIRAATNDGAPIDARRAKARDRLEAAERHPIPERVAGKDRSVLRATFEAHLESQSAVVRSAATPEDVPEIVAGYLRESNLPQRVRTGSDDALAAIDWGRMPTLEVTTGPASADDAVGLSRAIAGVAETGTLILGSGDANPVTLNFLPETHIVLVDAASVVGPYEDAF
ncbi:MAG: LUD domain-containing protein, partial [Pseudomonadota bacterium]